MLTTRRCTRRRLVHARTIAPARGRRKAWPGRASCTGSHAEGVRRLPGWPRRPGCQALGYRLSGPAPVLNLADIAEPAVQPPSVPICSR